MRRATIRIVSTYPWLLDPMPAAVLEALRKGAKLPDMNKGKEAKDVASAKFYRDNEGYAGIPIDNITACLVEAGRSVKNGKKQISVKDKTTLFELVPNFGPPFVRFANIPKGKKEPHWVTDVRRGVGHNANPPVAVAVTRPRLDEVILEPMVIEYDDARVDLAVLVELFRVAGTSNGLCSGRPNKGRMLFGRFKIVEWKEETIATPEDMLVIVRDGVRINRFGQPLEEAA
ncbi:MAG: hypothetical protein HY372_02875 [Candidatus Andersenbacteria bacterium]|nr:hypothetical protein [Candidatus Andersenbacteria bacterium]